MFNHAALGLFTSAPFQNTLHLLTKKDEVLIYHDKYHNFGIEFQIV